MTTEEWSFDQVADTFQEHAARHLPGYADVQELVALIAQFMVNQRGRVADLGCSTGETIAAISKACESRRPTFYAYDESAAFLSHVQERGIDDVVAVHRTLDPALRLCGLEHRDADLTVALWTLQFIRQDHRVPILSAARACSNPHGAILVAAKSRQADVRWEDVAVAALDSYKAQQGVTPDERVAKTAALRGVLRADTVDTMTAQLRVAGWYSPTVLWRWHVWTLIGAFASPSYS